MVEIRYSGGVNNRFSSTSIGGEMSEYIIPNNQIDNLFDKVTRVQIINGRTEFRLFYIYNKDSEQYIKTKLSNIKIPENAEISFAVDSNKNPQQLESEDSVPNGLTFYKFDEWDGLKIFIGNLKNKKSVPVWIRRKVLQGSNKIRIISFDIEGDVISFAPRGDFSSIENIFNNYFVNSRSNEFYTDLDKVGEALLS